LALLLTLFGTGGQAGAQVNTCGQAPDPPGAFVVDTQGEADAVATSGYSNSACNLTIKVDLPSNLMPVTLILNANTITVDGSPGPARVDIVNDNTASAVQLVSKGDIILNFASVKAHKNLRVTCTNPACKFTSTNSDIVTAANFANPQGGGVITFDIVGDISITTTNLHGGDSIEMESKSGSITILCGAGVTPCKDPLQAPVPAIIAMQCPPQAGDPPGTLVHFPCTATFPDGASLTSVCIGEVGVNCNGGHKEKRFTAFTFIDITNSKIVSTEHITFTCKTQDFRGSGSTLEAEHVAIRCQNKVDLSNSQVMTDKDLTIVASNCPAAGTDCVDLSGAVIFSDPVIVTANGGGKQINACGASITEPVSGGFPKFNSASSPTTYNVAQVLFSEYTIGGVAQPPRGTVPPQCGGPGTGTNFNP
jgi:hypothetical protein